MELYQREDIPADLLGTNINKLYNEKASLQASFEPIEEVNSVSFDLIQELIEDAANIWDYAEPYIKNHFNG